MTDGLVITTDTEEIDRLARWFDDAVAYAGEAWIDLQVARLRLLLAPAVPDGSKDAAMVALDGAVGQVARVRDRAAARAAALREANRGYDAAEDDATTVHELVAPTGSLLGVQVAVLTAVGGIAASALTGGPLLPANRVGDLLRHLPVHRIAGFTQIAAPHVPYLPGVARASILLSPDRRPLATPAAGSLADVADRVRLADDAAGDGQAVVDIQRIEHTDGSASWTVAVHGTKDGLGLHHPDQPFSLIANKDAYLGLGTPGEKMVIAAMEEAGIPAGDPVLLAGHSQGGIAMTRLATNHAFRERFAVKGVVTFGAPVAHLPSPKDAAAVHLQHVQDGVASVAGETGGREGGAEPGEVYVIADLEVRGGPTAGFDAHSMENYVTTTGRMLAADHPATGDLMSELAPLLAEEGAVVTAATYRGTRSPVSRVLEPTG